MKYKAVFFDLDGTLMDTSEGVLAGGRYAMEKVGIEIPADARWITIEKDVERGFDFRTITVNGGKR